MIRYARGDGEKEGGRDVRKKGRKSAISEIYFKVSTLHKAAIVRVCNI